MLNKRGEDMPPCLVPVYTHTDFLTYLFAPLNLHS